jgi:hypothetical protein
MGLAESNCAALMRWERAILGAVTNRAPACHSMRCSHLEAPMTAGPTPSATFSGWTKLIAVVTSVGLAAPFASPPVVRNLA